MKLIILYDRSDGYTWSCTDTIPIEYESEEKLLIDIEEWGKKELAKYVYSQAEFMYTGITPDVAVGQTEYGSFRILTLDKWFEQYSE